MKCVCLLCCFSLVQLFVTQWIVAHQALLSMEFSREEYWSGLPFPSPGDLPDLGIEPESPTLQADSLSMEAPWSGVPFPSPGDLPPGESKQAKTQADKMGLKEGLFSNETKFNFLLCTHQKQELRQHVSGLASMRQLREFRVLFFLFLFAFLGHDRSCWGVPSYFCSYVGATTFEGTPSFTWSTHSGMALDTHTYLLAAHPFHTHGSRVDTQRVSSGWVTCDTCLMVVNPASDSDRRQWQVLCEGAWGH